MFANRIARWCSAATLLGLVIALGLTRVSAEQRTSPNAQEEMEFLTRGPLHEAFAETISFDPQPGVIIPKMPPAAIEELPPEYKPEGDNVAWISGYWAWDDESNDFLWISGVWRALPPGRQWVPGYWGTTGQGAQWISGYWADAQLTEVEYLPEPPESIEEGPNVDAPSADYTWLPGCWMWQQNRYVWRPGYWTPAYDNWVWTPAHYQWAPRGYVFVDGYWDYSVQSRGVLFAPVSFSGNVYSSSGFSYTPSVVIDLGVFTNHLFVRPNYNHYYFGDYYGANYAKTGFYSSFSFNSGRHGYDPIYAHQRWNHRQDRDWDQRFQADFQQRRDHEEARPPRTFAAQQELRNKSQTGPQKDRVFAQRLEELRTTKDSPIRFQPLNTADRQRFGQSAREVQKVRTQRQTLESQKPDPTVKGPTDQSPAGAVEPGRGKLPRSPLVGKRADELGQDFAPPKTHQFPKPDVKVVPQPRKPFGQDRNVKPNRQPATRIDPSQPLNVKPAPQPQAQSPKGEPKPQPQPPKADSKPKSPKVDPKPQPSEVAPKPQPRKGGREEKPKGKGQSKPKS